MRYRNHCIRLLLCFCLLGHQAMAATDTTPGITALPLAGIYTCIQGNNDSICDQDLKPYWVGNTLTAVRVEYVGWCGSMGPYTYPCKGQVCEDAGIRIEFKSATQYQWENKQYGFRGVMKRGVSQNTPVR